MESVEKVISELHEESRSLWVPTRIPEYHDVPNALLFLRDHVCQSVPCVWRAAARDWPAVSRWTADDNYAHLRQRVGSRLVDVACTPDGRADAIVELRESERNGDERQVFAMPMQKEWTIDALLDGLASAESEWKLQGDGVPYYSAQDSNLTKAVPELLDDVDSTTISFATEAFGAQPVATNVWIGDERSITTMHADPFENLYVVASGCKSFVLRPPCDSAFLPKPNLQCARWTETGATEENGSVGEPVDDVTFLAPKREFDGWTLVKEEGRTEWIDESKIPTAFDDAVTVHVHAGDMLYLPALWCT